MPGTVVWSLQLYLKVTAFTPDGEVNHVPRLGFITPSEIARSNPETFFKGFPFGEMNSVFFLN